MATTVRLLNLDSSVPIEDAFHQTEAAASGVVRFLNANDANKLPAFQRVQGDLINRFKLIEAKINEIIRAAANGELGSDTFDGGIYSKLDGSAPFTEPVAGINPIRPEHLSTKAYVDDQIQLAQTQITEFAELLDTINETSAHYSAWTTYVWQAAVRQVISLSISPQISDINDIAGITLLEKVNVAVPTVGNPSPTPRYLVRPVTMGQKNPFGVDDIWFDPESNSVKVAVPNTAFYQVGYDQSYLSIQSVSFRQLRAVVTVIK